jgi:hypothetical protein
MLDLSETSASLLVMAEFKAGEDLEVSLEGISQRRPIRNKAVVIWCVPTTENRWVLGVKFHGTVRYADLNDLTRM